MTTEFLNKKISKIEKLKEEADILLDKIKSIFVKEENIYVNKISIGLKHLMSVLDKIKNGKHSENIVNQVMLYTNNTIVNNILEIINDCFNKILDKKINVETFLSQTFINETREYNQKVQMLFAKIKKEIDQIDKNLLNIISDDIFKEIMPENTDKNIKKNFIEFTNMISGMSQATLLYKTVTNKILQHITAEDIQLSYEIMNIVEMAKNTLLSENNKSTSLPYTTVNPFIKNFGLINTSGLLSINDISQLLFHNENSTIQDLIKTCKTKEYDLIVIKKILNRGIEYNILPLVDYSESKKFDSSHNNDDGISEDTITRYRTIDYITPSPNKWEIKYEYSYENATNKFVLILQELAPKKYCILSNKLEPSKESRIYFVRKSVINEFIKFVKTKSYNHTRVNNYNEIINEKIVNNMFLYVKPDIESLKIKSQVIDSKYLRNEIYVLILAKFKTMFEKKNIKSIYDFSTLIHDESLLKIFSQVIMNEYYKYLFKNASVYETENISASEVYSSFLFVINIYERDFIKQMHDIFINRIPDKSVFSDEKKNIILFELFEKLLNDVLHLIVTNESNIFQTIIYKLYLYKLSLLD